MVDGAVSHDQITRFLSAADYDGRTLWQQVKPLVRDIQQDDGVLLVDDTIQTKAAYGMRMSSICWHYDHSQNRSVKGINCGLTACIMSDGVSVPVTYELIRKPILFSDVQTRRVKRKSLVTKNELMRKMLRTPRQHNQLEPIAIVLADSWFGQRKLNLHPKDP